jgi:hypothetical protein
MVIEPAARGFTQVRLTFEDVIGTPTRTRGAEVRSAFTPSPCRFIPAHPNSGPNLDASGR